MRKGLGILLVFGVLVSSNFVYAQADTAAQDKEQIVKAINYVMPFAGEKMLKQNMKYLTDNLIVQKVPRDIVDEVLGKVETKLFDEIAIKVFSQYFTVEDAQAISAFYESSVGKKFTEKMPLFAQEYFKQSSEISFKIYQEIFDQFKAKGYPLDDLRKNYLNPASLSAEILPVDVSSADVKKE